MARRLLRDQSGATAVEYALVLAGIAAVIIAMVYAFGSKVNAEYNKPASGWP
ncbi:MAG TPA: Flp family type IVb pilin [Polyangia bacterium]|nr:Flp family type IVb pilin [Polyangia bacterium]